MDVETLATHAANGDHAALDALLREIQPEVLRRCGRLLPYRQDAEEACQDALMQVARNITGFAGRSKFSTWLYPVVSNCARQTYRVLKRRGAEQSWTVAPEIADARTTSVIAGPASTCSRRSTNSNGLIPNWSRRLCCATFRS